MKTISKLLLFTLLPLLSATASEYTIQKKMGTKIRFSYEVLPLSSNLEMGILGAHYDIFAIESLPYFYSGIGIYGGATGKEGGFFTLGYTLGVNYPLLQNLSLDTGYFVGAGGGSRDTFPGPGLMTRAYGGLEYSYKNLSLRAGVAQSNFPGTTNTTYAQDTHAYVGIGLKSDIWQRVEESYTMDIPEFDGDFYRLRIAPSLLYYHIDDKPVKRSDRFFGSDAYQADMILLGLQVERFIDDNLFFSFEAYGAGKSAAGYAAIHGGVGYVLPITSYLNWENKLIVGLGGDGRIDTGGGVLLQPMSGLSLPLTDKLSLKGMIGRTYAPDGAFSSTTADVAISWQAFKPDVKRGSYKFSHQKFFRIPWNISAGMKFYRPKSSLKQTDGTPYDPTLGLIGIDLGVALNDYIDIIGNTYWALSGDIGSYAEGMFGVKTHTKGVTPLKIKPMICAEIGVAGGGRMIVDSALYQLTAGVSIPTGLGFDLELAAGQVATLNDSFNADVATFKLNWNQISLFQK